VKLFSALGPGDIVSAYRAQVDGRPFTSVTSITFSGQLLELCRARDLQLLAISYNPRRDQLSHDQVRLENRPHWLEQSGGVKYHFSRVAYAFYLAWRARIFGADLAIIDSGTAHYFALAAFRLVRVPVAVNFHNTIWPNGFEPHGRLTRLTRKLDGWFFRWVAAATSGVSPECGRQVQALAGRPLPFFEYRAQFLTAGFHALDKETERNPFRVIFVGRAERSKGVLDIAAMAQSLRARSSVPVTFDVCGDGSALAELRQIVAQKGLQDIVRIHGQLNRPDLLKVYRETHAVIVPTRSDFCEGLPLVCAEAVLSGLPIITSRLSNAIPVLGPALVEAEPDNVNSFVEAIIALAEDHATYDRLRAACPLAARQFIDRDQSYPAAIDRLISCVFPNWKVLCNYDSLFERVS
jgi:glycogen(starch) synthase